MNQCFARVLGLSVTDSADNGACNHRKGGGEMQQKRAETCERI